MKYISLAILFSLLVIAINASVPENKILVEKELKIPANIEWTNTEVILTKGEILEVKANGSWNYDSRPQFEVDANGLKTEFEYSNGILIGKIGEGDIFIVGKSFEGVANYDGELYLGMYDKTGYANNKGELNVIIKTYRKAEITIIELENQTSNIIAPNIEEVLNEKDQLLTVKEKTICNLISILLITLVSFMAIVKKERI